MRYDKYKLQNLPIDSWLEENSYELQDVIGREFSVSVDEVTSYDVKQVDLNFPRYYGQGLFVLDSSAYAEIRFSYRVPKGDDSIDLSNATSIEDFDDYYLLVEDIVDVEVKFAATMKVNENTLDSIDFSVNEIINIVENSTFNFDSFSGVHLL